MTNVNEKSPLSQSGRVRFGTFEVDFGERELRNRGVRVNLQRKPFQILELLLRRPGALVTREELARYLWPDLHVSFSHGLNTAVNTLRQALSDSPASPRFIETRSGLGYRFIAQVEEMAAAAPEAVTRNDARKRYEAQRGPYQDYLKGRYLQSKQTRAELGKSIAHFEAALAEDRQYALAYTGLAESWIQFAALGFLGTREAYERAAEAARRALEIDPELAEARAAEGRIRQLFERDLEGAEAEYRRAMELNPGYTEGYLWYAGLLAAAGRTTEALNHLQSARELETLSLALHAETAWILYMTRRFEECANESWQALVLEARFAPAQHTLGLAYEQTGVPEEAITELHNASLCSEDNVAILASLGHAMARGGHRTEAEAILTRLAELGQQQIVSPYWRAVLYTGLGANDLAIASLREAQRACDPWLIWLHAEPRFDTLRESTAFARVAEQASLHGGPQSLASCVTYGPKL